MKMIREKDTAHHIFEKERDLDNVLGLFRFEEPSGYMTIRRVDDVFRVRLSAQEEIGDLEEIKEVLKPYLNGKVFMTIDVNQKKIVDYIETTGIKNWFGFYDMSIDTYDGKMTIGSIRGYEGLEDQYNHILGKAFEPMRTRHDFKPYDWYGENPAEAHKEYLEADKNNNFYSYYVNDELVGVAICYDNVIDVIGIEPSLQKNGYGRDFLRGVIDDMFKKDIESIEINVVESNQHVYKLYSDEGFKTDCHKRMYKNY
ncbi:GNAT family N-acetyltransferase [Acidaminobacter sp. JC074]|uniref:GNAT family N-acetyltransferase n=1 Tax=Acidaminobacter sp. JC074 TaxID=2530199 RepID=UPI001F0EFD40|nr:GNAT family N-acetyltransferase [Acidaminobacter sp. JC074]MCH4890576.1 GNAT family N-acetyltransferase [Acidaminobacter sp. JC074]